MCHGGIVPDIIEEAGAIVLRKKGDQPEILLIFSKKQPRIRIFPKGHIEPGETSSEAATRELLEEAGVEGTLLDKGGTVTFDFNGNTFRVIYYYFRFIKAVSDGEPGRKPAWFSLPDAAAALSLESLRKLVTPEATKRLFSRL